MKKRLLSTLLMGAFFVASMSMFVSCKDYADDINANTADIVALQKQLATINTSLATLQANAANYASKSDITSLQQQIATLATINQLTQVQTSLQTLIAGKVDKSVYDAKVAEIKTSIDAINSSLNTLGTTLNTVEGGYKAADLNLQAQIDALKTFQAAATNATTGYQAQITALTQQLAQIQSDLQSSTTIDALKTQMADASAKVDALAAQINILTVYVKRNISSLVLKPATYYGGIEGVTVLDDEAKTYKEGVNLTYFTVNPTKINLSGIGVAYYHVNPSTADISRSTVGFYSNIADLTFPLDFMLSAKKASTRSTDPQVATPVYTSTDSLLAHSYFANGILAIPFKANFDLIKSNLDNRKGSFIAAQISKGDTTVTSDYAIVAPNTIYDLLVADKSFTTAPYTDNITTPMSGHLHKKFSDLAVNTVVATHNVKYNESINISALLETHFTKNPYALPNDSADVTSDAANCGIMDAATFQALGLKYVVKTVNYTLGSNLTSETAHIQLSTDASGNVIATPRNVDASGNTILNTVANASAVGRMPMLVIEIQNAQGTIMGYGYMKLLITDLDATPVQDMTSDAFAMNDYYFDCNGASNSLTWSQVEFHIYNDLLKVSKATFESTYTFVPNKQYKLTSTGYVETDTLGTVSEITNATDPTTNVLKWSFTSASYAKLALAAAPDPATGLSTKDVTVIVKYQNNNGGGDVYIPLTIKAGKLHFATANLSNTKTLAQWYQYQSAINATSAADAFEVRANVPVPTVADNVLLNTEFVKDLHDYFLNGALSASLNNATKFPLLAAEMATATPSFEFTLPVKGVNADFSATAAGQWTVKGYSGATYTLQLSADNLSIKTTTGVTIVQMDANGVVTYVESAVADDILNYAAHNQLGSLQTFTAYVHITLPDLCYEPSMNQTYFNVRFLRPLNLSQAAPYQIIDAPNDWQNILFTNLVSVTDWRDYTGLADNTNLGKSDGKNQFDFAYYGIQFTADVNGALTDANLGTTQRANYANTADYRAACVNALTSIVNLQLVQSGDTVKYINNSGTTGTYHIFLPIKMQYVFGTGISQQKTWSVITVQNTVGNAKRFK